MCDWCHRTRGGRRVKRAKVIAAHLRKWKEEGRVWTYFVTYSPPPELGLRNAEAMHGWYRSILDTVLGPCSGRMHVASAWWAVEAFKRVAADGRLRVHLHGFWRCPRARVGTWRRFKELFWSSGAGRLRCSPLPPDRLDRSLAYAMKYMLKEHKLGRYVTGHWRWKG